MVTGDRVSDLNVIITYICARVHTCKSMPLYPCACGGQFSTLTMGVLGIKSSPGLSGWWQVPFLTELSFWPLGVFSHTGHF